MSTNVDASEAVTHRERTPVGIPFLHPVVNVGPIERILCALGGGALVAAGARKGSVAGAGMAAAGAALLARAAIGHCPLYQALGHTGATLAPAVSVPAKQGVRVEESIVINRPARELFAYWRQLDHLPFVMEHLESVEVRDDGVSHWVARGPLGRRVEWDAEIINEVPDELIAWRSRDGSDVQSAGSVHFKELGSDRGTRVEVVLRYNPPAGKVGAAVAKLLGDDPAQQIRDDLRRFRQLMETGETATTDGQSAGSGR